MKSLTVAVLLLTFQLAHAQQAPLVVIEPPPPEAPPQLIPPMHAPDFAERLHKARQMKLAGALLMGLGGGLLLTSTAVFAWQYTINDCQYGNLQTQCRYNSAMEASAVGMALGFVSMVVGIPVYVVGHAREKRAIRGNVTLSPTLGGASLRGEL